MEQKLDRNFAVEFGVVGGENNTHTACSEAVQERKSAKLITGSEPSSGARLVGRRTCVPGLRLVALVDQDCVSGSEVGRVSLPCSLCSLALFTHNLALYEGIKVAVGSCFKRHVLNCIAEYTPKDPQNGLLSGYRP